MLIPDISGFTHFVNHTEIIHSVHIIAEMLETLIDNNSMGLKVAEVEGDAVFFYRIGEKPSAKELHKQIEKMYFSFHKMKAIHNRDRICDCGACTTVNGLKIKFVSHYGEVVERSIHNHFQLMGSDVIKIHKLLKNNIDDNEYLLITENSLSESKQNKGPYLEDLISKSNAYDDFGEIKFQFTYLDEFKKNIPTIEPARQIEISDKPLSTSVTIRKSMEKTYAMLIDLDIKKDWVKKLKKVVYNENQVFRNGSSHDCVVPLTTIHIETVESIKSETEMVFTEFTEKSNIFPAFYSRFVVRKIDDDNCKLIAETHYKGSNVKAMLLRLVLGKGIKKNLINFKELVENSID